MAQIDYLTVGHITRDLTPEGDKLGGAVSFSSRLAQALGCRTAVLTSCAPDFIWQHELPGVEIVSILAGQTTTFENVYTSTGRIQTISGVAAPILAQHVPEAWRRASIVHLGPVADEVDPAMIHLFSNSMVCLTPQGWLRQWDENGRVSPKAWRDAPEFLPLVAAVIVSHEDLPDDDTLEQYQDLAKLLVVTRGHDGCTVYYDDEIRHIPTPKVKEVDATGAGDTFATAFFVRLYQTGGNPWEAARFANEIAALSVGYSGVSAKITAVQNYLRKETGRQ
ncbi:MAG: PfkB family carbohydrate kinase [Chloroflexota bacterium]